MTEHSSPRRDDGDLPVSISFEYGWCTLSLGGDPGATLRATWFRDAFSDLLRAMNALLDGSRCQSVIWMGEGRGWFLDLFAGVPDGLGVAVHTMRDPDDLLLGRRWSPARGEVVFETFSALSGVTVALADVVRQVELAEVDATDVITSWGWRFPRAEVAELERRAALWGYRPRSREEYQRINSRG